MKKKNMFSQNEEKFINYLVVSIFFIAPLNFFIKQFNILYLDVLVNAFLICSLLIYYFFRYDSKIEKDFLFILFFFLLSLSISGIFYSSYLINWIGLIIIFIFTTLPGYYIARKVKSLENLFFLIEKVPFPLTIMMLLIFLYKKQSNTLRIDDMFISYGILPAVIISIYLLFNKNKKINVLYIAFGLFVIITHGSRGPLLAVIFYIFAYALINAKKNKVLVLLLSSFSVLIYLNLLSIVNWMIGILNNFNYTSRTLYKIKEGSIASGTGRNYIQEVAISLFKDNPFTGVGIGVERIHIFKNVYLDRGISDKLSTSYPHNLFIELLSQFGVLGMLVIFLLLFLITFSFLYGNKLEKNLLLVLFSISFIELMLSSSYLLSPQFFFYIGICYSMFNKKLKVNKSTGLVETSIQRF